MIAAFAALLPASMPAAAQPAAEVPIDEVIVTAQKRAEKLQRVPIAISAFTAKDFSTRAITDLRGVGTMAPNVSLEAGTPFSGTPQALSATIRGIGLNDFAFNFEPGVGVYLDGVYLARTVGANLGLLDVERVEILKGPQGTLFGRNTIGGAISVVTRDPGDAYALRGAATVGSLSRRDVQVTADLPLADQLSSTMTIATQKRDGWQKRIPFPATAPFVTSKNGLPAADHDASAGRQGGQDDLTLRSKLKWQARDALALTLAADWTHEDQPAAANTVLATFEDRRGTLANLYNTCISLPPAVLASLGLGAACGPVATTGLALAGANTGAPGSAPGPRLPIGPATTSTGSINTSYANGNNFARMDSYGGSLTADWQLSDELTLKSITGYRHLDWKVGLDGGGSPISFADLSFAQGQHQTSQEFQLAGRALASSLNYVVGLYYFDESGFSTDYVNFAEGLLQIYGPNHLATTSYAAFAHADYQLTGTIGLVLGARYAWERKRHEGEQADLNGFGYKIARLPITAASAEILGYPVPGEPLRFYPAGTSRQNTAHFTPTAGLTWQVADEAMAYFTYSKGFKSGGWTIRLSAPLKTAPSFGPEKAESYEAGLKAEFFDRRLQLDLAAFRTRHEGIQLNFQQGLSPTIRNAGNAVIQGLELEQKLVLAGGLSLRAAAGYLDAHYTSLLPGTCTSTVDPCISLASRLPRTPEWKMSLGPDYVHDLADGGLVRVGIDWSHSASFFNDAANTPVLRRPAVDQLGARLSYTTPGGRYVITAGGTNITGQRYLVSGTCNYSGGYCSGTYSDPSAWYLDLKVRFD